MCVGCCLELASRFSPRRRNSERRESRADGLSGDTAARFETLRALRRRIAQDEGVPAYMVFPDRTLIGMAEDRPSTLAELRAVDGVGERKLALYGEVFLEALNGAA